jgi:hypothetical protein
MVTLSVAGKSALLNPVILDVGNRDSQYPADHTILIIFGISTPSPPPKTLIAIL